VSPEQWNSVEIQFEAISALPASERGPLLAAIEDPVVRDEVAGLLESASYGGTLDGVIGAMAAHVSPAPNANRKIGPYRIERRLGQGGQGTVFEAVRDDGTFEQKVAIKIVKWDVDSPYARDRFRKERQLLAGLSHPYIARLLDGGETEEGAPYLVMEFVEGRPLTDVAGGWPLERKLELFLEIAAAVAYAHRNLIVHRDLKPANILVTSDGHPKLLDFGVAKLLDKDADVTATVAVAMTPAYASPEQVMGRTIGTASDVYSLGVVLYELLTGRLPYKIETLTAISIERAVCDTDPPPAGVSEDLDNILRMALRKEPDRRYAGVHEMAEDIERSMKSLPVRARPDTIGYRTSKFFRRNRWPIGAAAMLAVALGGGVVASQYQARIAQQRFEQVRRLAHSFVFDFDDDISRLAGSTAVREKMVRLALEYLDNLSKSAGGDLGLQKELAAAYQKVGQAQGYPTKPNLGHTSEAVASFRKADEIHQAIVAREPAYARTLGGFYTDFAGLLRHTRDYAGAIQKGESALASEQQLAREHPDDEAAQVRLARIWFLLGDLDEDIGNTARALERNRSGYGIAEKTLQRWRDQSALEIAQTGLARIGTCTRTLGSLTESLQAFDGAEATLNELLQLEPSNPGYHRAQAILAQFRSTTYYDDGGPSLEDAASCLKYSRQYLDAARQMVARDKANAAAKFSLAVALFRISVPLRLTGSPGGALEAARESAVLFDELVVSSKSSFLVMSRRARGLRRLSAALLAAGQTAEARAKAEESLAAERQFAARDANDFEAAQMYAQALMAAADADFAAAPGYLEEAEQKLAALLQKSPEDLVSAMLLARARGTLAAHYGKVGERELASRWAASAARVWREFPKDSEYVRRKKVEAIGQPGRM
jgi:tRNA A-37 threonylcarbamoyl transferase component Bud32